MYQEVLDVGFGRPCRVVTYDSVRDFARIKDGKCRELWDENVVKKFGRRDPSEWFGVKTRAEFDEVLEKGHRRYADMVREKEVSAAAPRSVRRRKLRGDHGDEVCVHRINAGNLSTAWSRLGPKARTGVKNIRLVVSTNQSCFVDADAMQWVGVAALAVSEAFERAGYRVAIDAAMGARNVSDRESIAFLVPLKTYDAPLDVQGLSSAVCFAGFFRGPGFMNFGLAKGEISGGLGQPFGDDDFRDRILPRYYTDPSEAVELVGNGTRSKEKAEEEIARIVCKYGEGV